MNKLFYDDAPVRESMHRASATNDWVDLAMVILAGIFVAGVLFLVYKLITKPANTVDPLQIAKERYAKGEITTEEFTSIKKELK